MSNYDLSHIVLTELITGDFKWKASTNGGEHKGACPFCGGDDRFSIWNTPHDGNPAYWCRQCNASGDALEYVMQYDGVSFPDALAKLGIESNGSYTATHKQPVNLDAIPDAEDTAPITKVSLPVGNVTKDDGAFSLAQSSAYNNLEHYALSHGIDSDDLIACGWSEVEYQGRKALEFTAGSFKRWRFIDGNQPKYISEKGFTRSWYGLSDKVIKMAKDTNSPLFYCNGEISAIAGRSVGIPAITVAGGGEKRIPDDLLNILNSKWDGRIAIVLDNDEAGRTYSQKIAEQLGERAIVIEFDTDTQGYDLADFVRDNHRKSLGALKKLIPLPVGAPTSSKDAAQMTINNLDINAPVNGKPLIMPFSIYHHLGGYALVGYPGKLSCIAAPSGHGKTSNLNSMIDTWLRDGEHGIGIMPEFEGDEYHWDRVQRYSGFDGDPFITVEKMMLWEVARYEHQNNIPKHKRKGYMLNADEMRVITNVSNMVDGWQGEFTLYSINKGLEIALEEMGQHIISKRGTPEEITFAAFDYVQILNVTSSPDTENVYEYIVGKIKDFVMRYKIHGLVTSQVNKTADKNVRNSGELLNGFDMRYIRDDKFNLVITLNPVYDELSGELVEVQNTGGCYATIAHVSKNTKGRKGKVHQLWDARHLTFLDQTYTAQRVDLSDL